MELHLNFSEEEAFRPERYWEVKSGDVSPGTLLKQ
jgi:hypothetical protein